MQSFEADMRNRIVALVQAILQQNGLDANVVADTKLVDIGLTSMDMVNLMLSVEAEFDFTIPQGEITPENFQSVETLQRMLARQLRAAAYPPCPVIPGCLKGANPERRHNLQIPGSMLTHRVGMTCSRMGSLPSQISAKLVHTTASGEIMTQAVLGIIGGSGIYDLPGLENAREEAIRSPWGEPSSAVRRGTIAGLPIVFLPRHDRGHRLSPSDINYRANIDVLKRAGVTDLVSLSACGSFKQELPPGTFVLVDQFVDRTHKRESSFFGKGCVAHVSMAHPVSPRLRIHLAAAAETEDIRIAREGTYVCMEGPQFSSYAESMTYKNLGYSVIGMTNMPEAKLAREAEICYATVAMVTDFDCWHPDHDAVTVQDIVRVLSSNADKAQALVARLAKDFPREHEPCPIGSDRALDSALITAPEARDPELLQKLDAVAGRVLGLNAATEMGVP